MELPFHFRWHHPAIPYLPRVGSPTRLPPSPRRNDASSASPAVMSDYKTRPQLRWKFFPPREASPLLRQSRAPASHRWKYWTILEIGDNQWFLEPVSSSERRFLMQAKGD